MKRTSLCMAVAAILSLIFLAPAQAETTLCGEEITVHHSLSDPVDQYTAQRIAQIEAADTTEMIRRHDLCQLFNVYNKMEEVQLAGYANRIEYFAVRRVSLKQHIYEELIRRCNEADYLACECHSDIERSTGGGSEGAALDASNDDELRQYIIYFQPVNGEFPFDSAILLPSKSKPKTSKPRTR